MVTKKAEWPTSSSPICGWQEWQIQRHLAQPAPWSHTAPSWIPLIHQNSLPKPLFSQQMGENEAMPESLKWITWLFLSQCHHCKPNPSELRLPHFVKKFRNFDDNYLQTTDEVMAVPPSTPLTSLSIMWVAPTKLIVVAYCGCLASSWNEDMFHYRPCSCKRTEGACTHIENSETSPNFSTRIQISRLPDTVILL